MADTCVVGDTSAPSAKASEKENLQDPCSHLQQPSHPTLKSQVPKKALPSLLTLSRQPLRDSRNLQEPNVNSAVIAEDECISLSEGRSLKCPGATNQVLNVTMTGPAVDSFTVIQADTSASKNEEDPMNAGQEKVSSSYAKNIKDPPLPMTDDSASLSNHYSVLDVPNQTRLNSEVTFFPSVQEGSEENADLKDQVGLQLSRNNGSHQQTSESLASSHSSGVYSLKQFFKSEHRKCLTPIWEMSPLREGETVMGGEGDKNVEKMESLFQSFFAQECANVIDNIRRGTVGQFCAKGRLDTLEVTDIEEESLPHCADLSSILEWSCFQPEKEAVRPNIVCLDIKEKVTLPAEKVEEVPETSGGCSANFSSQESFDSVVMGKTRSIHENHVLEASLKDPLSLCDDSNCKGKTFLKSDVENTNQTYVLHSDNPQEGQNVTVNLTGPKTIFSDVEADKRRSKSNCNDTHDLQQVPEAVRKDCDGVKETEEEGLRKVTPSSSENAHLAEGICNDNVGAEDRAGISGMSFNCSLDFNDRFLVTSTPMPMHKSFHFTKGPDATMLEQCEQHPVVGVGGHFKGDTVNLGGADGSVTASTVTEPPAVNVKDPKNLPKSTTLALRQGSSARSSKASGQRKFLLRPSVVHSSAKTVLPSAQPLGTRRMSLPTLPQTAPKVSAGPAPPSHPSAPVCFGKKPELTSGLSCEGVKTASCWEAAAVAAPGAKRHSINEAKPLTTSGLQKPRVSGLLTCTTRLGLKPHGVTVPTEGVKGRGLQLPIVAQKKPHSNTDACSASKRRRISLNAHSKSTEAPKGSAKLAEGPQGLRRLPNCLKELELKSKSSETSFIISRTTKVLVRPVRGTQGLRRPGTGLRGLESKLKNSEPGPLLNATSSVPDVSGDLASTSEHEKCATPTVVTDTSQQTGCPNCVMYQEEIARLKAALQLISGKDDKMG